MTGRKRLGELLVEAGEIDQMQLQAALGHQKQWGGRLGEVVVQMGFTTEERMVKTLSRQLDIPLADFPDPIHARVLAEVPREMAEQWGVIPLGLKRDSRGETLYIAMSDPTNYDAIDALQFKTGKRIAPMLAGDSKLQQLIRRYHHGERTIDLLPTVAVAAAAAQMQVQFSGLEVDLAAAELPTVTGSPLPPPAQAGALFEQTGSFLGDGGDDVATADEMLGRLAAPAIEDDPFSGISVEVPDGADVLNAPRKNGPDPTEAAPVSAADLGLILTPADAVVPTPAWVTQAVDVVPGGNIDVGPSASVEPPAPPMHDGEEVLQLTLEADGEADAEADADDDAAVDADDPAKLEPPQLDVATGAAASVSLAIEVALTSPAAVATPWTEGLPVASLELSDPLHIVTDRATVAGFDVANNPLIPDADAVYTRALPPP